MRAFSSALNDYENRTYDGHLPGLAHGVAWHPIHLFLGDGELEMILTPEACP